MIKLVVSDVDGTLIYKREKLNKKRFPVMLKSLADSDVPFFTATGRHYREIRKMFGEQTNNFISICCDGAYAVAKQTLIYSLPIPKIAIKYFFDHFPDSQISIEFHSVDHSYILGASDKFFAKEQVRLSNIIRITNADEIKDEIYFISVYGKDISLSHECLRVSYSSDGIKEFVNRNASKYNAVHLIAKQLKIADSEILAFGDSENDNELLKKSGMAYTTYCADKKTFAITKNHTRDVIGTIISIFDTHKKFHNQRGMI